MEYVRDWITRFKAVRDRAMFLNVMGMAFLLIGVLVGFAWDWFFGFLGALLASGMMLWGFLRFMDASVLVDTLEAQLSRDGEGP